MGIKIFCIEEQKRYEITGLVKKSMSWGKSVEEFAQKLNFEIVDIRKVGYAVNPVKIGSVVEVISSKAEFSGIVVNSKRSKNGVSYTAVDFMYYFNQNEEIYQFSEVKAGVCIESVISSMNAPKGTVDSVDVVIDKIYFNSSAGNVIKDIINRIYVETGKRYRFYYRDGKFHFQEYQNTISVFQVDFYNKTCGLNSLLDGAVLSQSIEGMKNAVKVVIKNNESQYKTHSLKDEGNIKKYGIMQKVFELEAKEESKAGEMAENFIKENSRVIENLSLTIPWVDNLYDGDNIVVVNGELGIDGVYRIINFSKTIEDISLELEPYG